MSVLSIHSTGEQQHVLRDQVPEPLGRGSFLQICLLCKRFSAFSMVRKIVL